ncbi:hypothetical protein D3C72_1812870 [compost metagenome]
MVGAASTLATPSRTMASRLTPRRLRPNDTPCLVSPAISWSGRKIIEPGSLGLDFWSGTSSPYFTPKRLRSLRLISTIWAVTSIWGAFSVSIRLMTFSAMPAAMSVAAL